MDGAAVIERERTPPGAGEAFVPTPVDIAREAKDLLDPPRTGWARWLGPIAALPRGRGIGIVLEEDAATLCRADLTLGGARATEVLRVDGAGGLGGDRLRALLACLDDEEIRRTPIVVGVPAGRLRLGLRRQEARRARRGLTTEERETLVRTRSTAASRLAFDHTIVRIGGQPYAAAWSCARDYVMPLVEALEEIGARRYRIEPSPEALLPELEGAAGGGRGETYRLHVLEDRGRGVALLAAGGVLLHARGFHGRDAGSVVALLRSLPQALHASIADLAPGRVCEEEECMVCDMFEAGALEVHLHGPGPGAWAPRIELDTGHDVKAGNDEPLRGPALARTLAGRPAGRRYGGIDLARDLRPPAPLRDLLPRRLVAAVLVTLGCLGGLLLDRLAAVNRKVEARHMQIAMHEWAADLSDADLVDESALVERQAIVAHHFFSRRVLWSDVLGQLPRSIPRHVWLTSLRGEATFDIPAHDDDAETWRAPLPILEIGGSAVSPLSGSAPREIDALLSALRDNDVLRREFGTIEVSTMNWRRIGTESQATFLITCGGDGAARDGATGE